MKPIPRNPPWTRDELILALDLYFRAGRKCLDDKHPDVVQLSKTLSDLPMVRSTSRRSTFRNANGVSMKLANFSSLDPQFKGKGLAAAGRLDGEVWRDFSGDPSRLRRLATSILEGVTRLEGSPQDLFEEESFPEGRVLERVHKLRERNRSAVTRKLRVVRAKTGRLRCEICDFDFFEVYGELGEDFAECHHRSPISEGVGLRMTKLDDLSVVCANCHRMLHRTRPMPSVEALRELVRSRGQTRPHAFEKSL